MGERGSPGRSRRARHQPDERVRGANPSDPAHDLAGNTRQPRSRLQRRQFASRSDAGPLASNTVSSASSGAARNLSIASRFVSAQLTRGDRCPSVPRPGLPWSGRCGNTVGSPKPLDSTVLDSGSRLPRCPSDGSTAVTTCGRSESMKFKVFENPCGSSGTPVVISRTHSRSDGNEQEEEPDMEIVRRRWARPVVFLLVCLAGAGTAFAQGATGTLTGTVVDGSGAAVPGATVNATEANTGTVRTVVSNEQGLFRMAALIPAATRSASSLRASGR